MIISEFDMFRVLLNSWQDYCFSKLVFCHVSELSCVVFDRNVVDSSYLTTLCDVSGTKL